MATTRPPRLGVVRVCRTSVSWLGQALRTIAGRTRMQLSSTNQCAEADDHGMMMPEAYQKLSGRDYSGADCTTRRTVTTYDLRN